MVDRTSVIRLRVRGLGSDRVFAPPVCLVKFDISFVHLCGQVVFIAFGLFLLLDLGELLIVAMVNVQHVVELRAGYCRPANDFLPVCTASSMVER